MPAAAAKKKSKALVKWKPRERAIKGRTIPTAKDRERYFRYSAKGLSIEEIAAQDLCTVEYAQASIDIYERYKQSVSDEMVVMRINETVIGQMGGVNRVIGEGLKANKVVHVNKETGAVTERPDHAVRLKTVETVRGLVETVRPKVPGLQLNQQFNNGIPGQSIGSGMSFEAVLRKKREQKGLANEQSAEVVEAELTHEEEIAKEFADFGGDEDEEEAGEEEAEVASTP